MQYLSANPIQLCKLLPGIANLIALMATTNICPAYNNPVRKKIHLWKKADMVSLLNTSHTSLHQLMQVMTNCMPLKWSTTWYNQTWENTYIKWLSERKKAFTKSGERDKNKNHLLRLEKTDEAGNQSRFYWQPDGYPGSCH